MGNEISSTYEGSYTTGKTLGCGTFAKVKHCTRISDKKEFAVKIIEKSLLSRRELVGLKDEIRILKAMNFPHILSINDSFDNGRQFHLVLELCDSDDLHDRIVKSPDGHFSESKSAYIITLIARTINYLHEHFVVHRDLKPENILFTKNGVLKVSDYGLAHYLKVPKDMHFMHTCCGTPHYVAPEVLNSSVNTFYSYKVDYWSLGVILYIMLCGFQPFNSRTINGMYSMILKGEYFFPLPYWANISNDAKQCVMGLMCVDVKKRINASQLMRHSFIIKNVNVRKLYQRENTLIKQMKNKSALHLENIDDCKEVSAIEYVKESTIDTNNTNMKEIQKDMKNLHIKKNSKNKKSWRRKISNDNHNVIEIKDEDEKD